MDSEGLLRRISKDPKFRETFSIYIRKSQWEFQFFTFSMLFSDKSVIFQRWPREFSKLQKTFFKSLIKYIILAYFSMKFNKQCVNFWRVWTKNTSYWEFLRKFSKIFKKLSQKFVHMLYFSIFFKRFNKPMHSFSPFGQKRQIVGKFPENFENSIENLHFIMIFGKFVIKNRAFGNNTIFPQQLFRLRRAKDSKDSTNPCVHFSPFGQKDKLLGNFEKILKIQLKICILL